MTDSAATSSTVNGAPAVRTAIRDFIDDLSERVSSQRLQKLVFGTEPLSDSGCNSDDSADSITHRNLVEAMLTAVEVTHDRHPAARGIDRDRWPDFRVTNTIIPFIGETKPLNESLEADDQLRVYLLGDRFESPFGILTNGVEWRVIGPDRAGSGLAIRKQVTLESAFVTIAEDAGIIEDLELTAEIRSAAGAQILTFVRSFAPDALDDWSLIALPNDKRGRFMPVEYDSQTSFDDFL